MNRVIVSRGTSARFAFRFMPPIVRALVPRDVVGCYILMVGDKPVYVGRSDTCVQQRLVHHGLLNIATHFSWQPCRSPVAAFNLESSWYHHLQHTDGQQLLNAIHPDSPAGSNLACPF